ncbi:MAG: metallophosphoesterase [Candidatus Nanoarchaeia archaeon]
MKILAAGDIHGDTRLAQALARKAEKNKVDLVVLCGDLTFADSSASNLIGPFIKKKKKVLLIPGNHETLATADFLADLYDVTNLHGYSIKFNDVGFFGCGFANIGLSRLREDDMFRILTKAYQKIKGAKKKVMVTHVHPEGTLMSKLTSFFHGSTGVRKAVKKLKPDLLLCSHVHEAEGVEEKIGKTKVINVGREGKIIVI